MNKLRIRDSIMTVSTVWRRAFSDAVLAPRRFRRAMPEFRKVSDMLFHRGIGDLDVAELPAPEAPIAMLPTAPGYGGMAPQDLYALLRVVRWVQPRRVFEIGTFQGLTTAHMAVNCDAEIYTLDMPRDIATHIGDYKPHDLALLQSRQEIGRGYRQFNGNGRIHQLFGDSRTFDYSAYFGTMDLVLVDACHLFDYVISDTEHALQLLGNRGVILWHDFGNSRDVLRALQSFVHDFKIVHLQGSALALHARGISFSPGTEVGARLQPVA